MTPHRLVVVALLCAGLALAGPPAASQTYQAAGCFTDPAGDVTRGLDGPPTAVPEADVVEWCATHSRSDLLLSVRTARLSDPLADPTWDRFGAAVVVTTADAAGTVRSIQLGDVAGDGRFLWATYAGPAQHEVCRGPAEVRNGYYTAFVPIECVGTGPEAPLSVSVLYGRDADGGFAATPTDTAPDGGPVVLPRGPVAGDDRVGRLAGSDRIATAIAVSRAGFPDPGSAGAVVLASAATFPDALVAAPLAASLDAPVLLTPPEGLPDAVAAEIDRVAPADAPVVVMGGAAAVSPAVDDRLRAAGRVVERVAGDSRFTTALAAARRTDPDPGSILLAVGGTFGDALVAGASAPLFAGVVVLVDETGPPAQVRAYLDEHPDAQVITVGRAVGIVAGEDAAVVGDTAPALSVAMAEIHPDPSAALIASADAFPDALAGGALAARQGIPLLLTSGAAMDAVVLDHLRDRAPWTALTLLGGTAAVSTTVESQAGEVLG